MPTETTSTKISIVLIDDHQVFRQGLRAVLAAQPDLTVIGEAGDGASAYALVEANPPDVALVDISLPGVHGIVVARELKRRAPRCRVLILTAGGMPDSVEEASAAGVAGYALKTQSAESIVDAIRVVARGEVYWAPELGDRGHAAPRGGSASLDALSRREREIFDLIVIGNSNEAMSQSLHISVKTVETHRASINRKLGVHSTAELVRFAATNRLLTTN
jgi:DNA-binding NarL/FixJ family response regulator